nr:GEVED domain-containing protein [Aquimarina sp. I32.4]
MATTPSNLASSNITATTAIVNWNAIASATYDIRYRQTATTSWTTVAANSNSYNITGLSPTTSYEAQVRSKCQDGTASNYSNSINFTTTNVQISYCASNGNSVTDEYISNVAIGTINNTSGASTGGYEDNTAIATNLAKGESHTITITPTWSGTTYSEGYSVWIDYNNDGDFADSGEQVWSQNATRTTPVSGIFTIPSSATTGATRMRVSMKYNAVPTPCESFQYGEVEDYTVTILEGGPSGGGVCVGGISSFPYNESFENTLGQWTQSQADNIDWTIDANGTPSRNTGPSNANQGTYYIYVEASGDGSGFPNKQAILTSSCFDLSTTTTATFSFAYHMYGASNMGSIAVEASINDGTSWTSIWSQNQNQGNTWNNVSLDLSAYIGESLKLRFNRITGTTWQADIAIDNVTLTTGAARNASLVSNQNTVISIYPNPVGGDTMNVSMTDKNNSSFEIKNFIGQTVSKGNLVNDIDVSSLLSGVYFLQITTKNNRVISKRFVKR